MTWFSRLRAREIAEYADALRPELQSLRTPAAPPDLIERVQADRAAGRRVILPIGDEPARRGPWRYAALAAAVAVVVILLLPARRGDRGLEESFASTPILGGIALAQEAALSVGPNLPPAVTSNAARLTPVALEYSRVWHDSSGRVTRNFRGVVSLSADSVAGVPAWRVASTDKGTMNGRPQLEAETLYVARADLRLLARRVHVAPYLRYERINIDQRYVGDSVLGRMTLEGPTVQKGFWRPIARRLPPAFGPYLADAFAPVFLRAVPLRRDSRLSMSLVGWAVVPHDVLFPIEMHVVGDERVRVPAGSFDCWKLSVRFRGGSQDFWVRKSDGVGVRALDRHVKETGGTREVVLLHERFTTGVAR